MNEVIVSSVIKLNSGAHHLLLFVKFKSLKIILKLAVYLDLYDESHENKRFKNSIFSENKQISKEHRSQYAGLEINKFCVVFLFIFGN